MENVERPLFIVHEVGLYYTQRNRSRERREFGLADCEFDEGKKKKKENLIKKLEDLIVSNH